MINQTKIIQTLDKLCERHYKIIDDYKNNEKPASLEEMIRVAAQVTNSVRALETYRIFMQRCFYIV